MVKRRISGRVVAVTYRIVFGSAEAVAALLSRAACPVARHRGHTINTAFVERINLALRTHLSALGRKVLSFARTVEGLAQQVSISRAYPGLTARAGYNFCLPHLSLRLPLPEPLPTRGAGSPKRWQARTPAMAAGLTDHIWTMQEVLLFRVPPWRQEVAG